jgi:hypothetical protein
MARVSYPTGARNFSPLHSIQPSSGAQSSLLYYWYCGQGVKLSTHLHLVLRSRMVQLYLHSPIHLHSIVLNELGTGILPYLTSLMKWTYKYCHTSKNEYNITTNKLRNSHFLWLTLSIYICQAKN